MYCHTQLGHIYGPYITESDKQLMRTGPIRDVSDKVETYRRYRVYDAAISHSYEICFTYTLFLAIYLHVSSRL